MPGHTPNMGFDFKHGLSLLACNWIVYIDWLPLLLQLNFSFVLSSLFFLLAHILVAMILTVE